MQDLTQPYKLTKEADADLEEITRYTIKKWGERQAVEYLGLIEKCLCSIATNKTDKQPFPKKYAKLRVHRCEHHYIFYLRMEMFARIKNRIG